MTKEDIINLLKQYNLNSHKYIVISGAAMVLYGLKEKTADVDIAVDKEYYEYLLNNYNCTFDKINEYGVKVYFIDNIINFSTTYYDSNFIIIDNIKVQSIEDILILKQKLNREKDKKDITLIKKNKLTSGE